MAYGSAGFGSAFSAITGRIPTDLLSGITGGWTVQVKKVDDKTYIDPDDWFKKFTNSLEEQLSNIKNNIMDFLGLDTDKEEWIDIAEFDSFISFNGVRDSQLVENAVEKGSFRTANKIIQPPTFSVELGKGGWKSGIENVVRNLEAYQGSIVLCRIITPFGIIQDLNLKTVSYSFTQNQGSNLLIAKLDFKKIIQYTKGVQKYKKKVKGASLSDTVSSGQQTLRG